MRPDGSGDDDMRAQFRHSVREVLKQARAAREPQPVWAPESTDALAAEQAALLGWTGLLVEERWGGAGAGMGEAIVVAEELGAHLTPVPFLSGAVLGVTALSAGGSEAQQRRWLPALASGQLRSAALLTGPSGRAGAGFVDVQAIEDGDGVRLRGESGFVLDGAGADLLLVAARRPGAPDPDLFAVESGSAAVEATELLGVDRTRQLASVVFRDARVAASARLPHGAQAMRAMLDRGAVAVAADALGAARRALDMAVDYARQREQFGRPIGAFQAVKHKLADMYLLVQGAALAVEGAAGALDAGQDARRLVAVASSYARDAAVQVTGDAIQVHGGIGYTWEHDCHRLFKRAKFDQAFLGDPSAYRERLAALVLDQVS
ncbi:MAG TPA: acyl-CoA dehydrogenase family protein [Streptosporangiaceae bacterium]|nr:acyl-CoA dehydrogenase family protein [Streptosporangiaceae bacterium]